MRPTLRLGLAIAAATAVVDQLSKIWLIGLLSDPPVVIDILPFVNLVMVWNEGVSFGFLGGGKVPPWLLAGVAALVSVGLIIWLARVDERLVAGGIGLIVGGAAGNIVDRLWRGAVADFFDFHAMGYHWPAFNLADSAITVGVAILIIDSLLIGRETPKQGP